MSPWPFAAMAAMACLLFLYGASALLLPWWGVALLVVVWLALFVLACAWWTPRPRQVVLLPGIGLVVWVVAVLVQLL